MAAGPQAQSVESSGPNISPAKDLPSLPHQRHRYTRMNSQGSLDLPQSESVGQNPPLLISTVEYDGKQPQGLGTTGQSTSINRVPVKNKTSLSPPTPSAPPFTTPSTTARNSPVTPQTPGSTKKLFSPRIRRTDSGIYTFDGGGLGIMQEEDIGNAYSHSPSLSFGETEMIPFESQSEDIGLLEQKCPSKADIHSSRASWLSISILILSIYSTIFSGIWLILAIVSPRYGRMIHSGGTLSPSTASTIFALFAKTIELSFVTVFVTFLGQVLTRRSINKISRGVTIAELNMRTWVIQPGFMITHWQHLHHAGLSFLGVITLTAAFIAMFYTTASDALVSPHLKFGNWEHKKMLGFVQASYANPYFIEGNCQTPIPTSLDPTYSGTTCLSVEHAGQSYHNSLSYLATWAGISAGGQGISSDLSQRPLPIGMLYDNTTVVGSWVQTNNSNVTLAFSKSARVINNVTMSMPHAGVVAAAHDPINKILQPAELAGVGEYLIRASVVSPTVNVLCANMNETELTPLIYSKWPNASTTTLDDGTGQKVAYPGYGTNVTAAFAQNSFLNRTAVDDIFQWGPTYNRFPPVFPEMPIDFNSILNTTVAGPSDSNYMLIKSAATTDYTMCQIRSWTSHDCSTQYNVSGTTGGNLQSHCEDPSDTLAYSRSFPNKSTKVSLDYRNVASEWLTALSLNTGVSDANSSTSRLLSQLIVTMPEFGPPSGVKLSPLMPSLAETLAVMAGSTLLLSTTGSTFYHSWNYSLDALNPGVYLPFNASISSQQYTSGVLNPWQGVFYVVLFLVFAMNLFCLVYFFVRAGLVTDYSEPQNLFALAVNSPPSRRLAGSCGAGPEGDQLNVDWHVESEDGTTHFFIKEGSTGEDVELRNRRARQRMRSMTSYSKLSNKGKSWL